MKTSRNNIVFAWSLFLLLLLFIACAPYNTNINRAQVYRYPKHDNTARLPSSIWGVTTQTFKQASGWVEVIGKKGTRLSFSTDCLIHTDGSKADSIIEITLKECYDAEDYVLERAYTRTNHELLISAGSIFVDIKDRRGNLVVACEEGVQILMPGEVDEAMQYFSGKMDKQGKLFWALSDSMQSLNISFQEEQGYWMDGDNVEGFYTAEQQTYRDYVFRTKSLGWINCDKFWDSIEEKRPIFVQLPPLPKNCQREVMVILSDQKSILPLYIKNGYAYSDSIPVNLGAKIICIDYGKESVYLGYQNWITGNEGLSLSTEKILINEFRRKLEEII